MTNANHLAAMLFDVIVVVRWAVFMIQEAKTFVKKRKRVASVNKLAIQNSIFS